MRSFYMVSVSRVYLHRNECADWTRLDYDSSWSHIKYLSIEHFLFLRFAGDSFELNVEDDIARCVLDDAVANLCVSTFFLPTRQYKY